MSPFGGKPSGGMRAASGVGARMRNSNLISASACEAGARERGCKIMTGAVHPIQPAAEPQRGSWQPGRPGRPPKYAAAAKRGGKQKKGPGRPPGPGKKTKAAKAAGKRTKRNAPKGARASPTAEANTAAAAYALHESDAKTLRAAFMELERVAGGVSEYVQRFSSLAIERGTEGIKASAAGLMLTAQRFGAALDASRVACHAL